jgi:hypothetical protein
LLKVPESIESKTGIFPKAYCSWLTFIVIIILLSFGKIANAQSAVPVAADRSGGAVASDAPAGTPESAPQAQDAVSQTPSKPGSVVGTVLDQTGLVAAGAIVRLTSEDGSYSKEVVSGDNGQFSFSSVPPGAFKIAVSAADFAGQEFKGELGSGQTYLVPPIVISIATVVTDVKVAVDPVEVATEEVKEEEHQRVLGFIPNFYVTYHRDAAPLTTKLKFRLAFKSSTDPVAIAGAAFLAGLEQAGDQYPDFGQGMKGYGKRIGAGYADIVASTFLSGAIFPSLFRQDPRYYYKGTGSTKSRILHAVSNSVACRGDNGRWQFNYSNLMGVFGGAAVSSYLYPTKNRAMFTLSAGMVRWGESSLAGVVQEFVVRKLSKQAKQQIEQQQQESTQVSETQTNSVSSRKNP